MNIGMMWRIDNPKETFADNVKRAVEYYRNKYGCDPTLCLVHPKMLEVGQEVVSEIAIRPYRFVLPGHLWIGVEEE